MLEGAGMFASSNRIPFVLRHPFLSFIFPFQRQHSREYLGILKDQLYVILPRVGNSCTLDCPNHPVFGMHCLQSVHKLLGSMEPSSFVPQLARTVIYQGLR